jgi:1-acyl-sn-glycerol-3-phosphate acyltransferase
MTKTKHSTWRYRSPFGRAERFLVRWIYLKPTLNRALTVYVEGRENLKKVKRGQPFIAIANHSSHFDAPLIVGNLPWSMARRLASPAAADYWFTSWWKSLPTRLTVNAFPVDRDKSGKHKGIASELLGRGVPLLIMPEGTRSRSGAMNEFKPGAAALAIKYGVPIVPAAIVGAHAAWPPKTKKPIKGRPPVYLTFGEPILPKPNETVEKFNTRLSRIVRKLHDDTARANNMPTQAQMKMGAKRK